jgi:hypothetical protein
MIYRNRPKLTMVNIACEMIGPIPSIESKNQDMAIDGIAKSAFVIEAQPARLSFCFVSDIHSSLRFSMMFL